MFFMRYDTPVYFQTVKSGQYDQNTGNYGDDTIVEKELMASVMDTSTKTMQLIYGTIKQGSLTTHIQNHWNEVFNLIRIDKKQYKVDYSRKLKTKHIFVLSEVT